MKNISQKRKKFEIIELFLYNKLGYKEEYLLDTGLCKQYDDGRVVDTFHDRVMFPIHSTSGRVIAFGPLNEYRK